MHAKGIETDQVDVAKLLAKMSLNEIMARFNITAADAKAVIAAAEGSEQNDAVHDTCPGSSSDNKMEVELDTRKSEWPLSQFQLF